MYHELRKRGTSIRPERVQARIRAALTTAGWSAYGTQKTTAQRRRSLLSTVLRTRNDSQRVLLSISRSCHIPNRLIQSRRRAFGCFSLLILNDRAAPSHQLLDLSLAVLPLDRLFSITGLSKSFKTVR